MLGDMIVDGASLLEGGDMAWIPELVPPPGYHRHKCRWCAYVWEHHNVNDVRHGDGGAHSCPGCGKCNWSLGIYLGNELPRVRNGVEPVNATGPVQIHQDQLDDSPAARIGILERRPSCGPDERGD